MDSTAPKLLYGTAWKKNKTKDLVLLALRHGFTGVDTACQPRHYNEKGVGEALATLSPSEKNKIFIQTKFTPLGGQDLDTIPYDPSVSIPMQVEQSFRMSQKNLGIQKIDSLILHSPLASFQETVEAWKSMEFLVEKGLVKQLGISNCYSPNYFKKLFTEVKYKPKVIQNRFISETEYDREIRAFCSKKAIMYQGFWTLSANQHIVQSKRLQKIAKERNKTPAQILFRYLVQKRITPLIGTCCEIHMQEDIAVLNFELNNEEINYIDFFSLTYRSKLSLYDPKSRAILLLFPSQRYGILLRFFLIIQ